MLLYLILYLTLCPVVAITIGLVFEPEYRSLNLLLFLFGGPVVWIMLVCVTISIDRDSAGSLLLRFLDKRYGKRNAALAERLTKLRLDIADKRLTTRRLQEDILEAETQNKKLKLELAKHIKPITISKYRKVKL